ncbi:MAG: hypothetical protein U1E39_13810 [Planctomycetota bacterium]
MRRAVRIGLVVLGAAMAVYGVASLTGGWLGTPPWVSVAPVGEAVVSVYLSPGSDFGVEPPPLPGDEELDNQPAQNRLGVAGAVAAAGLALVAVGAWPRRRTGAAS